MKSRSILALAPSLLHLAPGVGAHPKGCKAATSATGKTLYTLSNEATNQVVAISIGADGKLSGGAATNTGGAGANGIDSAINGASAPDALFSQSALTVAGTVSYLHYPVRVFSATSVTHKRA